jgi:hypothetical protein
MRKLHVAISVCLLSAVVAPGLATTSAQAPDEVGGRVKWRRIVGIVQPEGIVGRRLGGVPCEVGVNCVAGTPAPWTVTSGAAEVDLHSGDVAFNVSGLVLAGDPSFTNLGTPGIVSMVKGTLVCNDTAPGDAELVDTPSVALSARGNTTFRGRVDLPVSCSNEPDDIVFLIRIADVSDPDFAALVDLWNAFGAVRVLAGTLTR